MIKTKMTRRQMVLEASAFSAALYFWPATKTGQASGVSPFTSETLGKETAGAAETITLGGDLTVNRLGFGAWRIIGPELWGEPKNVGEMQRLLHRVIDLGVNFIDTADIYGPEVSERLIGETLHPYPSDLVIATKGGFVVPAKDKLEADGSPKHLREACEASLRRLRLERIDLYQLHAKDGKVPLEDSFGELVRLQQEGKIRHIGASNLTIDDLKKAREVAKVVSSQNLYNVRYRDSDPNLEYCAREGLAFIPWSPLARPDKKEKGYPTELQALEKVAKNHGISTAQAALAWLLARSPAMLPIPGTSSIDHLEENVAAAKVTLTPEDLASLNSIGGNLG